MILFKKKLVLDAFTYSPAIMEAAPIDYAHKFYPNWWKELPKVPEWGHRTPPIKNMKSCYGLIKQYAHGIIMPLWADMAFLFDGDRLDVRLADGSQIDSSSYGQWQGFLPEEDYYHIKVMSPWLLRCDEEISFSFQQCVWNMPDISTVIVPPGVVDFKYQHVTNINMFVNRNTKRESLILPYGQPMVQITPHTERKLVLNRHLVSKENFLAMNDRNLGTSFSGSFLKRRRVIKEKGACPFFGNLK